MSVHGHRILHETNWLGTNLVFYNLRTKSWSPNITKVIDQTNLRFCKEGLLNYLQNGFVMFGLTPVEDVFYTLPNTTLTFNESGNFHLINNPDPLLPLIDGGPSSAYELECLLENWFNDFNKDVCQSGANVILPLSGGLDSRMLASYLKGKKYVHTFTYGISMNQKRSYEVGLAKKAAKKLQLNWNQIHLSSFHDFLDDNYDIYGVSTHAHSMYHFEFYKKLLEIIQKPIRTKNIVLQGIYADVWAGSWEFPQQIERAEDLSTLVKHHGIYLSGVETNSPTLRAIEYFEQHKNNFISEKYRILTAARMKVPLIRHLIETPRYFGLNVVSPFFDPRIVACMLNLPSEERRNRKWQREFIKNRFGKSRGYLFNLGNSSDLMGTRKIKLPGLELHTLPTDFPNKAYLQAEKSLGLSVGLLDLIVAWLVENRFLPRIFPAISKLKSDFTSRYSDYMTLYPIIKLIKMSDQNVEK